MVSFTRPLSRCRGHTPRSSVFPFTPLALTRGCVHTPHPFTRPRSPVVAFTPVHPPPLPPRPWLHSHTHHPHSPAFTPAFTPPALTGGRVGGHRAGVAAVLRIPRVAARRPRQVRLERAEQVVEGEGDDHVVVDADEGV